MGDAAPVTARRAIPADRDRSDPEPTLIRMDPTDRPRDVRAPSHREARLAGLASLETHVELALRALCASHPVTPGNDQADEIAAAHVLAERCRDLLVALDDYRAHVSPPPDRRSSHRARRRPTIAPRCDRLDWTRFDELMQHGTKVRSK